jgi:glycosyltransferase involved in cell wall biosynthesis
MKRAAALLLPSSWYEGFPRVLLEAYATGLPVIASDLGSLRELVEEGKTGLRVPTGDAVALADAVRKISQSSGTRAALSEGARAAFTSKYTVAHHLAKLLAVYRGEAPPAPDEAVSPRSGSSAGKIGHW